MKLLAGGTTPRQTPSHPRFRYDFIEHREHRRVTPHIVDVDECGSPAMRTQSSVSEVISGVVVMCEL